MGIIAVSDSIQGIDAGAVIDGSDREHKPLRDCTVYSILGT